MRDIKLAQKEKGLSRLVLIIIIAVVVLIGAGVGVALLMSGGDEDDPLAAELDEEIGEESGEKDEKSEEKVEGQKGGHGGVGSRALFWSIEPPLVVNYDKFGKTGFLQVSISVMTYNSSVLDAVNQNSPVIRNNLLLLFNGRKYEELIGAENQMRMQEEALAEVNRVLKEFTGKEGANNVYFTAYIMQ